MPDTGAIYAGLVLVIEASNIPGFTTSRELSALAASSKFARICWFIALTMCTLFLMSALRCFVAACAFCGCNAWKASQVHALPAPLLLGVASLPSVACSVAIVPQDLAYSLRTRLEGHPRFTAPKRPPNSFQIDHYAGKVLYATLALMDKNKDFTIAEHRNLLASSSLEFARCGLAVCIVISVCTYLVGVFPVLPCPA